MEGPANRGQKRRRAMTGRERVCTRDRHREVPSPLHPNRRLESIEILSDEEVDDDIEITRSTSATRRPSSNSTTREFSRPAARENLPFMVDDDIHIVEERHSPSIPQDVQAVVTTPIGSFDISATRNQPALEGNGRIRFRQDFAQEGSASIRVRNDSAPRRLRDRHAPPNQPARVRGPRRGHEVGADHNTRGTVAFAPNLGSISRYLNWAHMRPGTTALLAALQQHGHYFGLPDEVENGIMQRIERENESELDSRYQSAIAHNQKAIATKKEISKQELKGYTNDIKADSHLGCELCGTILGQGIPDEFVVDPKFDDYFEKYARELRVQSPWICVAQLTQADRDLLRRVFINQCGHVFCGRCVKNIGSRRRSKRGSTRVSTPNMKPSYYAPASCPAVDCRKKFSTKSLTELYF